LFRRWCAIEEAQRRFGVLKPPDRQHPQHRIKQYPAAGRFTRIEQTTAFGDLSVIEHEPGRRQRLKLGAALTGSKHRANTVALVLRFARNSRQRRAGSRSLDILDRADQHETPRQRTKREVLVPVRRRVRKRQGFAKTKRTACRGRRRAIRHHAALERTLTYSPGASPSGCSSPSPG
jgi:hypothetical protein